MEDKQMPGKVVKAGIWFTVGNVILKGIGFISTPIFARLLTKEELGTYSNISTVFSLITIIATLELTSSLIRARFEFKDDIYRYMSSMLALGNLITLVCYGIVCLKMDFFSSWLAVEPRFLHLIFAVLFFVPATSFVIEYNKYRYKYKITSAITISSSLLTVFGSLGLIYALGDALLGRTLGHLCTVGLIGLLCYAFLMVKGKGVRVSYWKYALKISAPLAVHLLSLYILGSSDKIMITNICGESDNAMYSIAYSAGVLLSFLWTSLNSAVSPWLGEKLNLKEFESTRKITFMYIMIYVAPVLFFMLMAPEIVLFMGGRAYIDAQYVVPPVMAGSVMQFLYTMYVNIEQFEKKTVGVAVGTGIAAALNVGLNALFIPRFGYIAAAFTTLASYVFLFALHLLLVKRMKLTCVYDTKLVILLAAGVIGISFVIPLLYTTMWLRYAIAAVYAVFLALFLWKKRKTILGFFKK